ncbi:MAG TPA: decaprenyl-phosphate phosphoribosyltransferase [Polyangia bacterium]|nr:decaprenyl-phosphate phosphoribosyltransferase [Polyangia bacterium]
MRESDTHGTDPNLTRPSPDLARPFVGIALLRAMRPKHWIKNLLVFAGFVFTLNERWKLFSPAMWEFLSRSAAAFVLFSLVSSSIYLLNDAVDVERDRQHPTKRNRPIASGALSRMTAVIAACVLMLGSLVAAWFLSPEFAAIVTGYVVMQLGYVFFLKHVALLDVFILAIGFVLRAFAGTAVLRVAISPWLFMVTLLGSLFLGFCKRRNELVLLEAGAGHHRKVLKEYTPSLLDSLISIVASSTIMAYSLYTFTSPKLPSNNRMMLTIPLVIFGMFRYVYLMHSKSAGGSPEEVFLTDKPLIATVVLWIAVAGVILTGR